MGAHLTGFVYPVLYTYMQAQEIEFDAVFLQKLFVKRKEDTFLWERFVFRTFIVRNFTNIDILLRKRFYSGLFCILNVVLLERCVIGTLCYWNVFFNETFCRLDFLSGKLTSVDILSTMGKLMMLKQSITVLLADIKYFFFTNNMAARNSKFLKI